MGHRLGTAGNPRPTTVTPRPAGMSLPRQDPHLGVEARQDLGDLDGNVAGAYDRNPLWLLRELEEAVRGDAELAAWSPEFGQRM